MGHKGWHGRGYLPHYDGYEIVQHVVFRLHDAQPPGAEERGDALLDKGYGSSLLRDPKCARIVAESLLFHDGERYALQAWCVMPNHVHVLTATNADHELGAIVQAWKSFTARRINALLDRTGSVWAADYFDRFMRDEGHYLTTKAYIEHNPVKAGLCDRPQDWAFSSAGWRGE
jgi:REP element-mobilizing transposase RayT